MRRLLLIFKWQNDLFRCRFLIKLTASDLHLVGLNFVELFRCESLQ
jgi:hypothetical protein